MTQTAAQAARKTLSTRLGTSPKTLHRKAMAKAAAAPAPAPEGGALEELFPTPPVGADVGPVPGHAAPPAVATAVAEHAQSTDDSAFTADGAAASAEQASAAPVVDIKESSAAAALAAEPAATPPSIVVEDQSAPAAPALPAFASSWSDADEKAFQAMSARRKAAGFQRRGRDVSAQRIRLGAIQPNANTVVATIVAIVGEKGVVTRGELIDLMATATFANAKAKPTDRDWCTGYIAGAVRDGFLSAQNGDGVGECSPDQQAALA
ncbi:hypothetical protein U5A82_06100 [Sphingobium sp. CR2-8]|uniref:hypothetical protein n=1 Tax=Sphingobium sp. CR2-8 TaxID=1306534 RepID=UPI002DBD3D36|nr:hypothetical protein [Sphingobium sp. CR2-8]MEC3910061.1 hypothetical protein [Sphingobium sp. CR2-8]